VPGWGCILKETLSKDTGFGYLSRCRYSPPTKSRQATTISAVWRLCLEFFRQKFIIHPTNAVADTIFKFAAAIPACYSPGPCFRYYCRFWKYRPRCVASTSRQRDEMSMSWPMKIFRREVLHFVWNEMSMPAKNYLSTMVWATTDPCTVLLRLLLHQSDMNEDRKRIET
jgi:hypothetical protein